MQAEWGEAQADGAVVCRLCPHGCRIAAGQRGRCGARENRGGQLRALTYGQITSAALDPIEKKPLYHFMPGGRIFSIGSWGCNFRCRFCQNWQISQQEVPAQNLTPVEVARRAGADGSVGVAYTYNEPLIGWEFVRDCCREVKRAGLKNVLVTNGFINPEPLAELLPLVDALNIDLKAFNEDFYQRLCGGSLAPVLAAIKLAASQSLVEVTTLLIPGENDDPQELNALAQWVAENCGAEIPAHLSAYTPRYQHQTRPTTADELLQAREIFGRHLRHVYVGNVLTADGSDTRCVGCGQPLVKRQGYRIDARGLGADGSCRACGVKSGIVTG